MALEKFLVADCLLKILYFFIMSKRFVVWGWFHDSEACSTKALVVGGDHFSHYTLNPEPKPQTLNPKP